MKCMMIIDNKFEELEAIATLDILIRGGVAVDLFSNSTKTLTGSHNITLSNLKELSSCNYKDYDCLILPGGAHYSSLEASNTVNEIIDYFAIANKVIAAICASPTILGRKGLLKGKKYTCFPSMNEDFGGEFIDTYCVVDGNLITSRSAASALDFGLQILNHLTDVYNVNKIKAQIYY